MGKNSCDIYWFIWLAFYELKIQESWGGNWVWEKLSFLQYFSFCLNFFANGYFWVSPKEVRWNIQRNKLSIQYRIHVSKVRPDKKIPVYGFRIHQAKAASFSLISLTLRKFLKRKALKENLNLKIQRIGTFWFLFNMCSKWRDFKGLVLDVKIKLSWKFLNEKLSWHFSTVD